MSKYDFCCIFVRLIFYFLDWILDCLKFMKGNFLRGY